jgi:hypothetical protein
MNVAVNDNPANDNKAKLAALSEALQRLHGQVLQAERDIVDQPGGLALLDKLVNDPQWAWLRPLSKLIADVDHVSAHAEAPGPAEHAVAAAHVRGLVFGEGAELRHDGFLDHYRPLLQTDPALASTHGELRRLVREFPAEPENESERLHARHAWATRFKQRPRS